MQCASSAPSRRSGSRARKRPGTYIPNWRALLLLLNLLCLQLAYSSTSYSHHRLGFPLEGTKQNPISYIFSCIKLGMIVQFAQFASLVQPSFWHELTNLKIDVLRLSDEIVPISASYSGGRSVKDRETGQEIALGTNLTIGSESFEKGAPQ